MSKILIINTGGTIGMVPTEKGYAPDIENFHRLLHEMPELNSPEIGEWEMIDMIPLLDSSNMTVEEWNKIGSLLAENYDAYDGFVILHGTDTMAYTASALSFMLENLGKTVVITGSQIPISQLRSDGKDNLITAMMIAAAKRVPEVCIYFHGELLRGNCAIKYSSDGFSAFHSPNIPALADAGISITYHFSFRRPFPTEPFHLQKLKEIPIGVIKVFPGIQFELFENIMTDSLKGVVIETFGAGNIPSSAKALLPILNKAQENGTVIVVCTQCPQGTVSLGAYETSNALKKAGAVSGKDMTTEAAVAKLYYLLSKEYDIEKVRELMAANLRGEM